MAVAAIVQTRTGSTRLPGTVLRDVAGKPLLAYLLERLERATLIDDVVVATSEDPSDDALAAFCRAHGVECHRGPLEDVAGRILSAATRRGLHAFVRISGDSPLLDQSLVDRGVMLLDDCEVVTNVHPRTFPHGQSVEAFLTDAFARGYGQMTDPLDLEHVTPWFYRHGADFRIESFTHEPNLSELRLAVDTEADLAVFAEIVAAMEHPHWTYGLDDVLELHRACVA
jgi:spore coat polysaccharide biosynthesis protein SpsF (cytidylyltransferase family)